MKLHVSLLAVMWIAASLFAGPAVAAPPAKFLETVDLPPLPDSAFARRRAWQEQETAHSRRPLPSFTDATALLTAANFANLGASAWTVTNQDLTVELDSKTSTVTSDAVVTVHVYDKGVSFLVFYGDPGEVWTVAGADSTALKTEVAALGSANSTYTVALPAAATPDADLTLNIHRVIKLSCGQGFQGFLQCNTSGTYKWMAGGVGVNPYNDGHAPYTSSLHIKTSANEVAAATGQPKGVDILPDGRKLWHYLQPERGEHNDAFAISMYQQTSGKTEDGKPIRVFTTPSYSGSAKSTVQLASDVIAYYTKVLAPFPWTELNFIQLSDNFGGGESFLMGIFAIQSAFGSNPGDQGWQNDADLLSHEMAHQWWGNFVSPQGLGDVSLSESLAEYSSCMFSDFTFGNRSQLLTNNLSFAYTVASADDKAVNSTSVYSSAKYVDIIYHKGSVVFDMLRREVGDDVMTKGLVAYTEQYGRDYATLSQLRAVMEKAAGRDLTWFFTQWFGRVGLFKAQVSARALPNPDGTWTVRVRVVQPADAKLKPYKVHLPVHIELAGGAVQDVVMDIDAVADTPKVQDFIVPAAPQRVKCDWQRTILRKFALGTPGDVNLSGLVDGADLVDMAYRQGRSIVHTWGNGKTFFFPDTSWNELYDLTTDGSVDGDDASALYDWFGTEAEEF